MIDPEKIPQYTGDLAQLEKDYGDLKADASGIRDTGHDVHSQFQGLRAYYKAPEAEQLFATTKPVADRSDTFATDLETVSSALSGYASEIRPLVEKLKQLKIEATAFVNAVKDDKDWEYDGDKVDHHNRIRDEITQTVAAFWAAERTCHNKITALWHGTQMVAGDGSDKKNQYGFNAADMKNAKLPWGDPVEEKHHWYEIGHWVKSFVWDGIVVDGIWGTIKGLGTLVGVNGWAAMGQAWKGLAQLATGLTISMIPGARELFWTLPDDKMPSWFRESRNTMKQTGKALLAWDEWGKNPARAAGAVTFNVLTTVFTGGEGAAAAGAGKAGAVAKALSVAGKAGRIIDPMTYVSKGVGAGLSKVGDIAKGLKGIGKVEVPTLPDGSIHLPEGHLLEPNGNLVPPHGTVEAPHIPQETIPTSYKTPSGLPSHWTIQPPESVPHGVAQAMTTDGHVHGIPQSAGSGVPSGVAHGASDGVHGGIPQSTGGAVSSGAGHAASNGIHGGIPKFTGGSATGGAAHAASDGIHGGIPKSTGGGVTGGAAHAASNGIHGGIPKFPGGGVTGGAAHAASDGIHGGIPHSTGEAVSAGGHTTTPWYHETPNPTHDVPTTTPHEAPTTTPHTGGHDVPGGHGDGASHGAGHDGAGHDHHGAGHDGTGHADDAAHAGDHAGDNHVEPHGGAEDGAAGAGHGGPEAPAAHGSEGGFEYKPLVSADEFELLDDAGKHRVAAEELASGTRPFPDDEAAIAYGREHWNDYVDNLDPSAKAALNDYTGDFFPSYKDMNGYLRGVEDYAEPRPEVLHDIAEMDRVLSTQPVPDDVMVVRGTGLGHLNLDSPTDMLGQTFPDEGYFSTSLGNHPVPSFAGKEAILHLRVPKGTPALWLEKVSQYDVTERELLLARGSEYKVTRVFMDEAGKWQVYGEVLPRP